MQFSRDLFIISLGVYIEGRLFRKYSAIRTTEPSDNRNCTEVVWMLFSNSKKVFFFFLFKHSAFIRIVFGGKQNCIK